MKQIILYISLLFFLSKDLVAQCIANGEFATYCGQDILKDGKPTFSDDCLPPWMPSHGTPQVFYMPPSNSGYPSGYPPYNPIYNVVFMWADGDQGRCRGEGILAPFTFQKGYVYKVQVKYNLRLEHPNAYSDGEFRLIAANNIHRPSKFKYGNLLPWTEGEQRIATVADRTPGDWRLTSVYSFTPDRDYNEFWIYPYTTVYNEYWFWVDWIMVCRNECAGDIYFNQGVLPANEPRSAHIYIGSSYGGSGTVTVSSTATTIITAANDITIKPEFSAIVSTGSFNARIEQCSNPGRRDFECNEDNLDTNLLSYSKYCCDSNDTDQYIDEYNDSVSYRNSFDRTLVETSDKKRFSIYPNPCHDQITFDFYSPNGETEKFKIFNSLGVLVKEFTIPSLIGKNNFKVDVKNLPSGSYFIEIVDRRGKTITQKIQKI